MYREASQHVRNKTNKIDSMLKDDAIDAQRKANWYIAMTTNILPLTPSSYHVIYGVYIALVFSYTSFSEK